MGTTIIVRDVPEEVLDVLAARAAHARQSLETYLRSLLTELASMPPGEDVLARARARVDATGSRVSTSDILAGRDADRR